ncbi:hypothetical protein N7457_009716 [Penicillium paradoxum]|uniref:uncharacterized protein n=1 Tax=Penicillium paradoxum TaxID=176176 RepID=UPI002548017D|nr:uncharacterized protein N7457_009716 [Penicillium paradoxum]KAJ5774820.1 hypothetical protein N7457_009716 [Penicillium paradoxum]
MASRISRSFRLEKALRYLLKTQETQPSPCSCTHHHNHHNPNWVLESDTWSQLQAFHRILCQRPAVPNLPSETLEDIDAVIAYRNSHNLLTSTKSISPSVTIQSQKSQSSPINLSCWKGDITTLSDVTAIVNAANAQLLGCFRPEHRCIDNVIHSAAGPRLREACHSIMSAQGHPEPTGSAKVTPGFLLPAQWVLHTVGPQLNPAQKPQSHHRTQLASCYRSCLDATELLPPLKDGRKVVVFCCISTGVFAFPSDVAAQIAVDTVVEWCNEHPDTSITDIIFDTFLQSDWELYQETLLQLQKSTPSDTSLSFTPTLQSPPVLPTQSPTLQKAHLWLEQADNLIISAGAGLSAATGLDYTSTALFAKRFPAFRAKGLQRLYDVFGFNGWDSEAQKWGYYFLHLDMARKWPVSPIYSGLLNLVSRFDDRYFVRTTNADGFFVKNGFSADRVATPQGQYRYLQCLQKCRPDAVVLSDPLVDAAMPFIDPVSQVLMDKTKIPQCGSCGGEMTLCVRGGSYFNSLPFREQERKWESYVRGLEMEGVRKQSGDAGEGSSRGKTVILELGVGLNTAGVLRWPNEDLVSGSPSQEFRLIRIGMDASGCVPWEMEEQDLAVAISADIRVALNQLLS